MKRIELLIIPIFAQAFLFIYPAQATHREVNGCGDDSGLGRFVPNQPVGVDFRPVCDDHDRCYGTLGQSREHCDNAFRSGLRARCEKELLRSVGGILGTVVTGGRALTSCYGIAEIYYQAVRERGGTAYSTAQNHAREELSSTYQQTVIKIYREILERDVDPSGMTTWTNALASGHSVEQVRRSIAESSEAQNKLNELYRRMLGREIDPSGRTTWTNALASGWTLQRVASEGIAPSPEYQRRQAVIQIYREILERDVDPSGMITWTGELNSGRTIAQVRRAIAESPEAQNKLNDLYRRMLCRDIDSSGRATWTNALASGWTLQRVVSEGIAPSPEYQSRGGRSCN